MSPEVREAIEAARTVGVDAPSMHRAETQRKRSFAAVRALVYAVIRELPEGMTVAELRDELEINNVQGEPT